MVIASLALSLSNYLVILTAISLNFDELIWTSFKKLAREGAKESKSERKMRKEEGEKRDCESKGELKRERR